MELASPTWVPRATPPDLPAGSAHVWRVRSDGAGVPWEDMLSPGERERLGRFHFVEDAWREATGRGALRLMLGAYLGIVPSEVELAVGPHGKPAVADSGGSRSIEFNVSHSGDWVLLAFARSGRVGIDIERWREIEAEPILHDVFRPEELDEWRLWPEAERTGAFFGAWVLKEAYLKALGAGLAKPLKSFRVRIAPGAEPALMWCADDLRASECWSLARLDVDLGYSAALAAERSIAQVLSFTISA